MRWEIWIEAKDILSSFYVPLTDVQGLPDDFSRLWMNQGHCSGKWYVTSSESQWWRCPPVLPSIMFYKG